jgi:hypothetical protein
MANPVVHAVVFGVAIIIPGGLVLYFAWRAYKAHQIKRTLAAETQKRHNPREAFMKMYPPLSLRARSRRVQLDRYKSRWRKKS